MSEIRRRNEARAEAQRQDKTRFVLPLSFGTCFVAPTDFRHRLTYLRLFYRQLSLGDADCKTLAVSRDIVAARFTTLIRKA